MKFSSINTTHLILAGGAVLLAVILARQAGKVAVEVAETVGAAIDPTSDENVFYQGTNAVGQAVTGDRYWTLGGAIYEWLHGEGS